MNLSTGSAWGDAAIIFVDVFCKEIRTCRDFSCDLISQSKLQSNKHCYCMFLWSVSLKGHKINSRAISAIFVNTLDVDLWSVTKIQISSLSCPNLRLAAGVVNMSALLCMKNGRVLPVTFLLSQKHENIPIARDLEFRKFWPSQQIPHTPQIMDKWTPHTQCTNECGKAH